MVRFFIFFCLVFLSLPELFAQEPESSPTSEEDVQKGGGEVMATDQPEGEPELIYQKRNQPKVNIERLRKDFEPPPKDVEIPRPLSMEHWSRFTGGLWFSYGSIGIAQPLVKISTDDLLMKNATERAWGFGGQLDFAAEEGADQALRARIGIVRSTITPQGTLTAKYPRASYETQANVLHLSGIQRWNMVATQETGHVWVGLGGQMNYALSTSRNNSSAQPRSALANSYSFNLIFAAGADVPITDLEDVSLEFQYLPTRGLVALIGFRSSL